MVKGWFEYFVVVEILEKNVSDHTPLLLDFGHSTVRRKTPFRFLNVLADHAQFLDVWSQSLTRINFLMFGTS